MDNIDITEIKKGMPGISPVSGNQLYEACMVCLHRHNHSNPSILKVSNGINNISTQKELLWENYFDDQVDSTWQDQEYCTDHGAVCLSALLAKQSTGFTIIQRARKGTGVDYWLGDEDNVFKARLEISGIFNETKTNTIESRFKQKKLQTNQSDNTLLPAYISVIEFSKLKSIFSKK
ncbi:MAG: hypothetical protein RL662_451 [Bacteroidota bacterium]|jgi:hypothetical protein